jgi:hypothetical protein
LIVFLAGTCQVVSWVGGKSVALADRLVDEQAGRSEVVYAVQLVLEAAGNVADVDVRVRATKVCDRKEV